MVTCKTPIAAFAAKAIEKWVTDRVKLDCNDIPDYLKIKAACFVSLHTADGSLRGCIGTLEPRHSCLALDIIDNAISACDNDTRFNRVEKKELHGLITSVDVLSEPERTTIEELDPLKYGVIVSDGIRRGVLLPALESIVTVKQQVDIAKRKAGLSHVDNNLLKFYRFTSTRYD
ncbi:MAG TPA: AmmeMemoRadiSam system protein A [Salinivirgaceae bacterium]|nr:AmmeMemoRadiSam system protein A [Salinivirgaceae bacterium]HQA75839.1 AmmeMemoRadiSam system protein A [Salinivirgaceae bacterium]